MTLETTPFDAAEYLETDEDIRLFLQTAAEEGTEGEFLHALKTVARAKGMTQIAKETGISRKELFRMEHCNPEILAAFGCKMAVA